MMMKPSTNEWYPPVIWQSWKLRQFAYTYIYIHTPDFFGKKKKNFRSIIIIPQIDNYTRLYHNYHITRISNRFSMANCSPEKRLLRRAPSAHRAPPVAVPAPESATTRGPGSKPHNGQKPWGKDTKKLHGKSLWKSAHKSLLEHLPWYVLIKLKLGLF